MRNRDQTLLWLALVLSIVAVSACLRRGAGVAEAGDGVAPGDRASETTATVPSAERGVRFSLLADVHFRRGALPLASRLAAFVATMGEWSPDSVVDLGDFGIQVAEGTTTAAMQAGQRQNLDAALASLSGLECPLRVVLGNHDAGWVRGGAEQLLPADLVGRSHGGEDITKQEWTQVTGMPGRFYSFAVKGYHFIVFDGNNTREPTAEPSGRDGGVHYVTLAGFHRDGSFAKITIAKELRVEGVGTQPSYTFGLEGT